jgi:putative glutamine amidotransferase
VIATASFWFLTQFHPFSLYGELVPLPIIGLTISRTLSEQGYPMQTVVEAYIQSLLRAGALPVLIPLGMPEENYLELLHRIDGVLFTGGGDTQPAIYGSQDHPLLYHVDPDRDRVEIFLLKQSVERGLPFLGICRGLQIINVALGGTLFEDILDQRPGSIRHDWSLEKQRDYLAHTVQITQDSRLADILRKSTVFVNSLHHQGIRTLAPGLEATAQSPDGLIEAFELPSYPFGLAVQWHPEWLPAMAAMDGLFSTFVDAMRA